MNNNKLKQLIDQLSYSELSDMLMEYAQQDKLFKKNFKNFIERKIKDVCEEDVREEVATSFCQIPSRGSRYDSYEDTDWHAVMEDCDHLFEKALQAFSMGKLNCAVAYPLQWLSCFCNTFTEDSFSYDNEGTKFSFACEQAIEIIEKVMRSPKADADFKEGVSIELSGIAKDTTIFDDYRFVNLKAFAKRMETMTLSGEDALTNIEELIEKHEYGVSLSDLIIQKATILFAMNKDEDAIRFLENNVLEKEVCDYLVGLLIEKHDYNHAIEVLEKAIKFGESCHTRILLKKEIEIYLSQDRDKEVTDTYRRLFILSNGDIETYKTLKERIPQEEWKGYLDTMMKETTFYYSVLGRNDKAEIIKEEYGDEALFEYLCTVNNDYRLELYSHYATQLAVEYQTRLIPYYMDALRKEATLAKERNQYQRVRSYMERLQELKGSEEAIKILLAEFRELYRRRPSFMRELNRIDNK